ncbi:hypothetical protein PPL_01384 [Heterostelium album PN500]|uniref:Uncharacterized protein n=1 Tax=Heterostelium pallidum (strain ATCC 26659 / Pp 5 / PN500) TaxID=670386 RepID=D3AZ44_HETP5|nr:hypothetical protein PPL_01384 [Heterostelium album PN500]EFA85601.1 hypothetical protein PPL_01384 [Heterostelium album PN500]|eukprot:XP_020437708.1 hypothetical protein PPL_01384 [Heterostelium album PN500]
MDCFKRQGIIPNSVNHLIIREGKDIVLQEGILPDSVQNIELKTAYFPTTKLVDNISFKDYENHKCSIRKLDDQYYILFGKQTHRRYFMAGLFHKSMFEDRFNVIKILSEGVRTARICCFVALMFSQLQVSKVAIKAVTFAISAAGQVKISLSSFPSPLYYACCLLTMSEASYAGFLVTMPVASHFIENGQSLLFHIK